jgi:hypothetical protein
MNTVMKAETSFRVPAFEKVGSALTDCLTVEQALVAGGLDWEVAAMPLLAYTPNGNIEIKDRVANTRIRNGEFDVLGVVGKDYQIVQNHEAFKVLDDIVDMSGANFNAAGALKGGKLAKSLSQHLAVLQFATLQMRLIAYRKHAKL